MMNIQVNLFNEKEQRAFRRLFNYLWIENYPEDLRQMDFIPVWGWRIMLIFSKPVCSPVEQGVMAVILGLTGGPCHLNLKIPD
jgi:hypothetical protein